MRFDSNTNVVDDGQAPARQGRRQLRAEAHPDHPWIRLRLRPGLRRRRPATAIPGRWRRA